MDSQGAVQEQARKNLGKTIIVSNFILNIVAILCLALQLIMIGFGVYKAVTFVIAYYSEVVEVQEEEEDKTVQSLEKTESHDLSSQKIDTSYMNETSDQMFLPRIRRPPRQRDPSMQRGIELERTPSISTSPDRDRGITESSENIATRENSPVRSRRNANSRGVVRRNQQAPPLNNNLFYLYQHNNHFKQAIEGVRLRGGNRK